MLKGRCFVVWLIAIEVILCCPNVALGQRAARIGWWEEVVFSGEENKGEIELVLNRLPQHVGEQVFSLSVWDVTAKAGVDYKALPGLISLDNNAESVLLSVELFDNTSIEGDRWFEVKVEDSGGAFAVAEVWIRDNERALVFDPAYHRYESEAVPLAMGNEGFVYAASQGNLIRLDQHGIRDTSFRLEGFEAQARSGAQRRIRELLVTSTNELIVGGTYQYDGPGTETVYAWLQRYGSDGRLMSDTPATRLPIHFFIDVLLQPDGSVIYAGDIGNSNNTRGTGRMGRLLPDGTADPLFELRRPLSRDDGVIKVLGLQADGRILVGGSFREFEGLAAPALARLDSQGKFDRDFESVLLPGSIVRDLHVLADDDFLAVGHLAVGEGDFRRLVRFDSKGGIDWGFEGNDLEMDGEIHSLIVDSERGWIYGAGPFERAGSVHRDGIARFALQSGVLDPFFVDLNGLGHRLGRSAVLDSSGHLITENGRIFTDGIDRQVAQFSRSHYEWIESDADVSPVAVERFGTTHRPFSVLLESQSLGVAGEHFTELLTRIEFGVGVSRVELPTRPLDNSRVNPPVFLQLDLVDESGDLVESFEPRASVFVVDNEIPNRLDFSISVTASEPISAFERLADGRLIVASSNPSDLSDGPSAIRALQPDGSWDEGFRSDRPLSGQSRVLAFEAQSDDWVLAGGWAEDENGRRRAMITRFHGETGELDETFTPPRLVSSRFASPEVTSIQGQSGVNQGKILVGGTIRGAGGQDGLLRLHPDGAFDFDFGGNRGFLFRSGDIQIRVLCLASDGTILVGGRFSTVSGIEANGLVRLDPNGQPLSSFRAPFELNDQVFSAAFDSEGRIVVGARFNSLGEVVLRLLPDGTRDLEFEPIETNDLVWSIALDQTDRIYLMGEFQTLNEQRYPRLARLLKTGEIDPGFVAAENDSTPLRSGVWDGDGLLLLGEAVHQFDAQLTPTLFRLLPDVDPGDNRVIFKPHSAQRTVTELEEDSLAEFNLMRIGHSDGMLPNPLSVELDGASLGEDFEFFEPIDGFEPLEVEKFIGIRSLDDGLLEPVESVTLRVANYPIREQQSSATLRILDNEVPSILDNEFSSRIGPNRRPTVIRRIADGRLLLGGFGQYDNQPVGGLVRVFPDGTLDERFRLDGSFEGEINVLMVEDDAIWVGGRFSFENDERTIRNNLIKIGVDGQLLPESDLLPEPDDAVWAITKEADGSILIGGEFQSVGDERRSRLARLRANGGLDELAVRLNSTVSILRVQSDGRFLVGGGNLRIGNRDLGALIRFLPDGEIDESFLPNVRSRVDDVLVLPDGTVIASGSFREVVGQRFRGGIVKLTADGQLDSSFEWNRLSGSVRTLDRDGDLLVLGGQLQLDEAGPPALLTWMTTGGRVVRRFPDVGVGSSLEFSNIVFDDDGMPIVIPTRAIVNGVPTSHVIRLDLMNSQQTTVSLLKPSAVLYEPQSALDVTLQRIGDLSQFSVIELSLENETPEAIGNVRLETKRVEFKSLERTKTVRLQVIDDVLEESTGQVTLSAVSVSEGTALGGGSVAIRVVDDDREGSLDTSFRPMIQREDSYWYDSSSIFGGLRRGGGQMEDADVWAIEVQQNQRILIADDFCQVNDVEIEDLARLLPSGELDLDYRPGFDVAGVELMALQSDDRLVVVNRGEGEKRLMRLRRDGQEDSTFHGLPIISRGDIDGLLVLPDDRIVIWGALAVWPELGSSRIAMLLPNGSVDPSFKPDRGPNNGVDQVRFQAPHHLILVGNFSRYAGERVSRIARVGFDGRLDKSFAPHGGPNRRVERLNVLGNGWLQIEGEFARVEEKTTRVATLSRDGTLLSDEEQLVEFTHTIPLSDRKSYAVGGSVSNQILGLVRLDEQGQRDEQFDVGAGLVGVVQDLELMNDGNLLLAGRLDYYDGIDVGSVIRINGRQILSITSITRMDDGRARIEMVGEVDEIYVLEYSDNLETWEPRDRKIAVKESLSLYDDTRSTVGFYRVRRE